MGKNVLIIGASGDIGSAIARELGNAEYNLLLHYNSNIASIDQLRKQVKSESILSILQANLNDESDIKRLLTEIVFPVDAIIFASGKAYHGVFQETQEMEMDEILTSQIKALWLITKHLLPTMIQKQRGKIIVLSSIWGDVGASNEVIYSTVKGAQNSFVKSLAKEVGPSGINVNGISPGFIDTKMNRHFSLEEKEMIVADIPMNRAGKPEEVGKLVSFLISEESNYIQGEIIQINGGW